MTHPIAHPAFVPLVLALEARAMQLESPARARRAYVCRWCHKLIGKSERYYRAGRLAAHVNCTDTLAALPVPDDGESNA